MSKLYFKLNLNLCILTSCGENHWRESGLWICEASQRESHNFGRRLCLSLTFHWCCSIAVCIFGSCNINMSFSLPLCFCHRGVELSHLKGRSRMPYKFACWVRRPTDLNNSKRLLIYVVSNRYLVTLLQAFTNLWPSVISDKQGNILISLYPLQWVQLNAETASFIKLEKISCLCSSSSVEFYSDHGFWSSV